jgi:peptide/nickel transport system ATP-binding protein
MAFNLQSGQSLGLVGESGSGKSITALALMGLLPSAATIVSGSAFFKCQNGETVNLIGLTEKDFQNVRGKEIAMIFQEPMTSLNPSMKCGAQVEEAVKLHNTISNGDAAKKCLSLFDEMQLPNPQKVYNSYPHQLSGGQKQRVMIAMSLAGNPSLLIADEPTTALDVTVQKEIIILLRELQKSRGMSLIFISHDLGVISEITDSTIVLQRGNVMESETTKQILISPKNSYTKGLIACRPPIDSRPNRLLTVSDFVENSTAEVPQKNISIENERVYNSQPILEVKNVDVDYIISRNLFGKPMQVFRAVSSASFNLFQGETLGIVGESGCGKTTLGRAILNLVENRNGSITFNGSPIESFSGENLKAFRREVQIVFQDPYSSLNPRLTIGEAIMEPLLVHSIVPNKAQRKARALELLHEVSLPANSFYRYPHEFSGGQRQRIVIARALALEPKVLICDEMVSALDVSVQAQILNLLNDLKRKRNLTYLFISHDLSVVRYMSNRILVMQNGQIVEEGFADDIFNSPKSEYTAKLIASIPGVKA